MAVNKTKQVQTLVNRTAAEIEAMRAGMARIVRYRDAYQAAGIDATGTILEGRTSALVSALTTLNTALNDATFDQLIAAKVPSHRGTALEV